MKMSPDEMMERYGAGPDLLFDVAEGPGWRDRLALRSDYDWLLDWEPLTAADHVDLPVHCGVRT